MLAALAAAAAATDCFIRGLSVVAVSGRAIPAHVLEFADGQLYGRVAAPRTLSLGKAWQSRTCPKPYTPLKSKTQL